MSAKQVLRKNLAQISNQLDISQIETQSNATAKALRALPLYQDSQKIAFYMHMDTTELQTARMIENAFLDGKRVFLPHIVKFLPSEDHSWFPTQKTHLRMLEVPDWQYVQSSQPRGKYKSKEPTEGYDILSPEEETGLDSIVLPGVGFSVDGGRLGHGAGYYDSFINEHEASKNRVPRLVGVGFLEQLLDAKDSPMEEHDRVLDHVLLGGKTYP